MPAWEIRQQRLADENRKRIARGEKPLSPDEAEARDEARAKEKRQKEMFRKYWEPMLYAIGLIVVFKLFELLYLLYKTPKKAKTQNG